MVGATRKLGSTEIGLLFAAIGVVLVVLVDQVGEWVPAFLAVMATTTANRGRATTLDRPTPSQIHVFAEEYEQSVPNALWIELRTSGLSQLLRIQYRRDEVLIETEIDGISPVLEATIESELGHAAHRLRLAAGKNGCSENRITEVARHFIAVCRAESQQPNVEAKD